MANRFWLQPKNLKRDYIISQIYCRLPAQWINVVAAQKANDAVVAIFDVIVVQLRKFIVPAAVK